MQEILMMKKTLGTIGVMSGIPFCHTEFMTSLAKMVQYNNEYLCAPGEVIHLDFADLSYHAAARNALVSRFLGDWLLMLDMDHAFTPDLMARLLYTVNLHEQALGHEVMVLTGMYHYRQVPFMPVAYMWDEKKLGCKHITDWDNHDAKLIRIDSAGGGCLFVKRKAYQMIYEELHEEPFSIKNGLSEDHSFFYRLQELGIPAYLAPKIQAAHLMTTPITTETHYTERFDEISTAVEVGV